MAITTAAPQELDQSVLLKVPTEFKRGNFSVRMPDDWSGTPGKIADALNQVIETNQRLGKELARVPVGIGCWGVGENGQFAVNDSRADVEIEDPYLIVTLDEACRQQQVGEAWFADLSQVPTQAISMSVRQILKAREILAVVPDTRKAQAIKACFEGEIAPMAPASILRTHPNATVYLDTNSAALLSPAVLTSA